MSGGGEGSRHAGCGRVGLNSAAARGPLRRTGRAAPPSCRFFPGARGWEEARF